MSDLTDTIGLHGALVRWFSEIWYQGVFATDRDLRVIVWNHWMEVHGGRPADQVLGRHLLDLFPDLSERGIDQYYHDALAGQVGVVSHGLHRFLVPLPAARAAAGAVEMPQSGRIAPLSDGLTIVGTVTTIEDVSDRLSSEAELRRQLEEQRAARMVAEQALRAKDDFLSILSHEMRTPLSAVLGWARILLERPDADRQTLTRALRAIERNAQAQTRMIEDLLDIARVSSGKIRLEMELLDIVPVALAAIDGIAPAARAKQIELRTSLDPDTPQVLGDVGRLQQVVWNLLSNALKFTAPGGVVEVSLTEAAGRARLQVRDTGEGISGEFLPFVFDRFRQSDTSTARRHGGLGLGLALVREIVELHGGRVTAASEGLGHGATFVVELPGAAAGQSDASRAASHAPADPAAAKPQAGVGPVQKLGPRRPSAGGAWREPPALAAVRVLVVAPHLDARELMSHMLEIHGAQVATAASAGEALDIVKREPVHIVIAEVGMRAESGDSLIQAVRQSPAMAGGEMPAIAVTEYGSAQDRDQAHAAGYDGYIAKPVLPERVVEAIRALLRLS